MSYKIDFITPHVMGNEREYLNDALDSNWIAPLGPYVKKFETAIKQYVGANHAVAVNSGTAAIHCALYAAGIKPGDKVAVADLTFIASANPITYVGAEPVFIDSEWESFNIDPVALEMAAGRYDLKAVIIPHLYGMPADMERIRDICYERDIIIIEDATEALGSTFDNIHAGMIGDIGCFSFNGNKIITSSGGGMVVTPHGDYAERALHFATQAKEPVPYYSHDEIGHNYRLSNLCAAIGLAQFETLKKRIAMKRNIFQFYHDNLDARISILPDIADRFSNRWVSCGVLDKPVAGELVDYLAKHGIESRRVWYPLHHQKPYKGSPFIFNQCSDYTASDFLFHHGICLPSDTKMTIDDMDYVAEVINTFLREVEI